MNNVIVVFRVSNHQTTIDNVYDSWGAAYIDHPNCIADFTTDGVTGHKTAIETRVWRDGGSTVIGLVLPVVSLDVVREHSWKEK